MRTPTRPLPWLAPGDPLPPVAQTWDERDPVPGLLAAGGALTVESLVGAYSQGVFPWFSDGQPILWWSPDPRMVLRLPRFRLHRSLRRSIERFRGLAEAEIRIDHAFDAVIGACAAQNRAGQAGTWIGPAMIGAYVALHRAGFAHSVETWIDGRLVAGLYCVAIGRAVFGESMFTTVSDGSKIALAALVALGLRHGVDSIDCQQNTAHLASLGAREIPRAEFTAQIARTRHQPACDWRFEPLYWNELASLKSGFPDASRRSIAT